MKRNNAFANATIALLVLLTVQCRGESSTDDSDAGGAAGESSNAGKGGSAGSRAGSAGKAGAGAAGKGGAGGTSGSGAGTAGTRGGSAGAGGSMAGEAGAGGANAGEGGSAGFDGTAGASGTGNGGAAGDGGVGASGDGSGGRAGGADGGTSGNVGDTGGTSGGDDSGAAGNGGEGAGPPTVRPGDTCAVAVPVVPGSYDGESTAGGFQNDYSLVSCYPYATIGVDRVYQVRVPSGNRLNVGVDPTGSLDPAVAIVATPESNCVRAPACLAMRDVQGQGVAESVSFANDSLDDRDYFVLVDSYFAAGGGYDMDVAVNPATIGDICLNPLPLGEGTEIAGSLALEGIGHDYHVDPCFEGAYFTSGPDVAYRLEIPAGSTLTVTINPSDDLDPALFLLLPEGSTCERNSCLGAADVGFKGHDETLTYTNAGASTQTVFLIVDTFAPTLSTPGPFHLDVDITG